MTPEGRVVKAIAEYLELQEKMGNGLWFRVRNMSYNGSAGKFMRLQGAGYKNGIPDICGCMGGFFVGFEVKAARGTPSVTQKQFGEALAKAGGYYFVVRSVDDVIAALKQVKERQ